MIEIIMPVIYRPDLIRVSIDSIYQYTEEKFHLTIVHEGDEPGVSELLQQYKDKEIIGEEIDIVRSNPKKGYVKAINIGVRNIIDKEFDYLMLINSDIVATPGWMTKILEAFKENPRAGIVVPTYTESGGIQSIEKNKELGKYSKTTDFKGVCVCIKRVVFEELIESAERHQVEGGLLLDERYELGGGDDNDLALRCDMLGYENIVARESYIYHYNSASFREEFEHDVNFSKKYASHVHYKFREKWKKDLGSKPRVMIAIPNFNGYIFNELAIRLIQWSHDQEIAMSLKFYPFMAPLDNARNRAVKDFLEDYWDYLMFIDDDIVPPPQTLRTLLSSDKDVIAPLCLTLKPDDNNLFFPMPVAHRYDKNKQYRPYYGKGMEETDVITGGCFLVKREVFEKIERPFSFTYHRDGTVEYSEDFYFSQKCQEHGYKLYTHYDLICKHIKILDVLDFNNALLVTERNAKLEIAKELKKQFDLPIAIEEKLPDIKK